MAITWGFLLLFTLFVFPGLILRRLYFFGEFSKQFGYNEPLLKPVAYALVPGVINAIAAFFLFERFIGDVDLGRIFDAYKEIADEKFRYKDDPNQSLETHFRTQVLPFVGLLYLQAVLAGAISGQLVRLVSLDTKFKLFRFKNQWFYLFTGHHRRLRKFQQHFEDYNKFLFLNADILIDTGDGTKLYTGTVVDYDLSSDDCSELRRVVLKDAIRYTKDANGAIVKKAIPGSMFIVDCRNVVNLNLIHVYESDQEKHARRQVVYSWVHHVFTVGSLATLPLLFFRFEAFNAAWYSWVFNLTAIGRFMYWLVVIQVIQFFNPIVQDPSSKEFRLANKIEWFAKLLVIFVLHFLALGVDSLTRWIMSWFS